MTQRGIGMRTEPDVPLFAPPDDKASRLRLAVLQALEDGRWHPARILCRQIERLDRRTLREISSRSRGEIISDDRLGYKLNAFASNAEITHCENRFVKYAKEFEQKAIDVRNFRVRRRRR